MTMTRLELQDKIARLARDDELFRARLLSDPGDAIQEVTGAAIPDEIDVQVHEESATSFHLVLPADGKLSEREMSKVFAGNPGSNPSTPGYGQGPSGTHR